MKGYGVTESRHLIGLSERRTLLNEASDQSHPISEPLVGLAIQRDVVVISEGARIVDNYGLAVGRDLGGVPPKTETKSRL